MPFSDPLADGPVIHAAATRALANGATLPGVLELARRLAERVPVVAMCYANPILARGVERFAHELAERGVAGLIVPDLPLEESGAVLAACDAVGVALVPLVAPTTPDERMEAIGAPRARLRLRRLCRPGRPASARRSPPTWPTSSRGRARAPTVPLAVGFGIATPEQAAAAADAGADGVIVGRGWCARRPSPGRSAGAPCASSCGRSPRRWTARVRRAMGLLLTAHRRARDLGRPVGDRRRSRSTHSSSRCCWS